RSGDQTGTTPPYSAGCDQLATGAQARIRLRIAKQDPLSWRPSRERIARPPHKECALAEHTQQDKDRGILHALGYAQELRRSMSGFSNFAISFTIISVLSGTLTLYATGINYGGPIMEAWGWTLVSFFVMFVGMGVEG